MQEEGYCLEALAPLSEDWEMFASAALPGVAPGSALYRLIRVGYYSGVLIMMGKMHSLAENVDQRDTRAIADAVHMWNQELEAFGMVEANDDNVDNLIAQCSLGAPAGATQH